ncbi:MAG: helix-turn-helix domain-containing protein, partial [Gammaproteobacteria bacterium]
QGPSKCVLGSAIGTGPAAAEEAEEDELLLEAVERKHILRVLEMVDGNKSAAARKLGVSRKTLDRKCRAWDERA